MPRLNCSFYKPKTPKANYISELLKRYKKANKLTNAVIATKLGTTDRTVTKHLNQSPDEWDIATLRKYCGVLGIPITTALGAISKVYEDTAM